MKKIESLSDYLKQVELLYADQDLLCPRKFFYRGHARDNWKLIPNVFRDDSQPCDYESLLIENAERLFHDIFREKKDFVCKLVLMQHYGLPTRLLDVTTNPLIALFFACQVAKEFDHQNGTCDDANGRVYYTTLSRSLPDVYVHSMERLIKSKLIKDNNPVEFGCLKKSLGDLDLSDEQLFDLLASPFLYLPALDNPRIRAQQGAFVVVPLAYHSDDVFDKDKLLICRNWSDSKVFDDDFFEIPKECKRSILCELDRCGINEAIVYPDIEHQMKYVQWKTQIENPVLKNGLT